MTKVYSRHYLEGIKDGREWVKAHGADMLDGHISATSDTARKFASNSPVGQSLRGELEFLKHWRKKNVAK